MSKPFRTLRDPLYADEPVNIEMSCIGFILCCVVSGGLYYGIGESQGGMTWLLFLVLPLGFLFFVPRRERRGVSVFIAGVYGLAMLGGGAWTAHQNGYLDVGGAVTGVIGGAVGHVNQAMTPRGADSAAQSAPPPGSFAPSTFSSSSTVGTGPMIPMAPSIGSGGTVSGAARRYGAGPQDLPAAIRPGNGQPY